MSDSVATDRPLGLAELIHDLVAAHAADRGPLLPILHDLQHQLGYVPNEAVGLLAKELNLSRADVFGVVTFYRDFRDSPPTPGVALTSIKICRAEACQSVGAEELVDYAKGRLGVGFGELTGDGRVLLDQVFCLGNCALGPSVEVAGVVHGRVDHARFDALIGPMHS